MQKDSRSLTQLTNEELLERVRTLVGHECAATAQLIASLAELDARGLYLGEGFPSLFAYCTQCLHLSEYAAYSRIAAARAGRRFPAVLEMLGDGSITLTTVVLLAPHLTPENHRAVLDAAKHRSRRVVEQQVAAIRPLPPVETIIRKLPPPNPVTVAPAAVAGSEMLFSAPADPRPIETPPQSCRLLPGVGLSSLHSPPIALRCS